LTRCPPRRGGARIDWFDCEASEMAPHPADVHHLVPGKSTVEPRSLPESFVGTVPRPHHGGTETRRRDWQLPKSGNRAIEVPEDLPGYPTHLMIRVHLYC